MDPVVSSDTAAVIRLKKKDFDSKGRTSALKTVTQSSSMRAHEIIKLIAVGTLTFLHRICSYDNAERHAKVYSMRSRYEG